MGIELKRTVVAVVAVALLGTGPVLASPPAQSPRAPDQDYLAILSGRASILLAEIQKEAAELLVDIQKETAELRPHPYPPGTFAWNSQYTLQSRVTFLDRAEGHINAVCERIAKLQHIRRLIRKNSLFDTRPHRGTAAGLKTMSSQSGGIFRFTISNRCWSKIG